MKNVVLVLAVISFFSSGCRRPDTDVTSSAEYNFSSFAGTVWKTKVKVGLADIKVYTGEHHITLLAPVNFDSTHPKYTPASHMQMIAVLPEGTRVRIERLMKDNGPGSLIWVIASLEDGKVVYVSRNLLAKNRFLSTGSSKSKDWGVDPDMLEKAE